MMWRKAMVAERMMRRQVAQGMMGRQTRGDRRLGLLRDGITGEDRGKRGRDDKGLDHGRLSPSSKRPRRVRRAA